MTGVSPAAATAADTAAADKMLHIRKVDSADYDYNYDKDYGDFFRANDDSNYDDGDFSFVSGDLKNPLETVASIDVGDAPDEEAEVGETRANSKEEAAKAPREEQEEADAKEAVQEAKETQEEKGSFVSAEALRERRAEKQRQKQKHMQQYMEQHMQQQMQQQYREKKEESPVADPPLYAIEEDSDSDDDIIDRTRDNSDDDESEKICSKASPSSRKTLGVSHGFEQENNSSGRKSNRAADEVAKPRRSSSSPSMSSKRKKRKDHSKATLKRTSSTAAAQANDVEIDCDNFADVETCFVEDDCCGFLNATNNDDKKVKKESTNVPSGEEKEPRREEHLKQQQRQRRHKSPLKQERKKSVSRERSDPPPKSNYGKTNERVVPGTPITGNTNKKKNSSAQLMCIHICADPFCNTATCKPPDIQQESKDIQKTLKDPSFFFVPVALVVARDAEMRQSAREANIPINRWNGSLLFRKWQEMQPRRNNKKSQRQHSDNHPDILTLHPVQSLVEAHVISSKISWWHSWLTVCIRAYYNTGTLRVPSHCHGLEILLALEFFGILYTSPDQLVFDAPPVYEKVKEWSRYFTHRSMLAQWVVDQLHVQQYQQQQKEEMGKGQKQKQLEPRGKNQSYSPPVVFCTNPRPVKLGASISLKSPNFPVTIMDGGLNVEGEGGNKKKQRKRDVMTSAKLVHEFFVPNTRRIDTDVEDPLLSSPETIPAMMRNDFLSYLQYILPEVEISFTLQKIQLVSSRSKSGQESQKLRCSESIQRAVLVATFLPTKIGNRSKDVVELIGSNNSAESRKSLDPPTIASHNSAQTRKSLDPPGKARITHSEDEATFPYESSAAASYSSSSCASSLSAAPTDEMAFGKLLSGAHKAVARLLEQSTQELVMGSGTKDDGFYFHREEKSQKKLNSTLDTTVSSDGSLPLEEDFEPNEFRSKSTRLLSNKDKQANSKDKASNKASHKRDKGKAMLANRHGNDISSSSREESVSVDHIYEDLYRESMFPDFAVPEVGGDQKSSATDTSDQSPLWTPSLVRGVESNSSPAHAPTIQRKTGYPVAFVNASPPDILSTTSSLTRQPESLLSGDWNTLQKESSMQAHKSPGNTQVVDKSLGKQSIKIADAVKVETVLSGDEGSLFKNLPDDSFEKRFRALLDGDGDGDPNKSMRPHQQNNKKIRSQEDLKVALDDVRSKMSAINLEATLDGIPSAAGKAKPEDCQFMNDIYELFVPETKPTEIVIPNHGSKVASQRKAKFSKSNSSTMSGPSEISSDISTISKPRTRLPKNSVAEAMGLSEEQVNRAAMMLKLFAGSSIAGTAQAESSTAAQASSRFFSTNQQKAAPKQPAPRRKLVLPAAKTLAEDEEEAKKGIEVYHIPIVSQPKRRATPRRSASQASTSKRQTTASRLIFSRSKGTRRRSSSVPRHEGAAQKEQKKGGVFRFLRKKQ